ncbi:MAG: ABC transporter permease [Bacteroidota bacterium]
MWMICKKEWWQFFSSLTGYLALAAFYLLNALLFFIFPATSLLDFGYATLTPFFRWVPFVLLVFIPVITRRSFADEYRSGSFELLRTLPLSSLQLVLGKFFGALLIVWAALLPTILYAVTLQQLSITGGIDIGGVTGSYIGLLLLGAVFTAVGIAASSLTSNTVVAFLVGVLVCLLLYAGFDSLSQLPGLPVESEYYLQMFGIQFHAGAMSRGVIDSRDLLYFVGLTVLLLLLTRRQIQKR